jgi:hypothetical protein
MLPWLKSAKTCLPEPLETTQGVESVPKDPGTPCFKIAASGRSHHTLVFDFQFTQSLALPAFLANFLRSALISVNLRQRFSSVSPCLRGRCV